MTLFSSLSITDEIIFPDKQKEPSCNKKLIFTTHASINKRERAFCYRPTITEERLPFIQKFFLNKFLINKISTEKRCDNQFSADWSLHWWFFILVEAIIIRKHSMIVLTKLISACITYREKLFVTTVPRETFLFFHWFHSQCQTIRLE